MLQVLTLANGDRILMTPQMKAFFEVSSSGLVVFSSIQKCEGNGQGSAVTHVADHGDVLICGITTMDGAKESWHITPAMLLPLLRACLLKDNTFV